MQSTRLWIPVVPRMVLVSACGGERRIMGEAVATCRVAGTAMRSLMGFGILRIGVVIGFRDG